MAGMVNKICISYSTHPDSQFVVWISLSAGIISGKWTGVLIPLFFLTFPVPTDCQYNEQSEMSAIQCYVVSCLWLFTDCTIHQISWNWSGPSCCLHCWSSHFPSWLWHICGKSWLCTTIILFPLAPYWFAFSESYSF